MGKRKNISKQKSGYLFNAIILIMCVFVRPATDVYESVCVCLYVFVCDKTT